MQAKCLALAAHRVPASPCPAPIISSALPSSCGQAFLSSYWAASVLLVAPTSGLLGSLKGILAALQACLKYRGLQRTLTFVLNAPIAEAIFNEWRRHDMLIA